MLWGVITLVLVVGLLIWAETYAYRLEQRMAEERRARLAKIVKKNLDDYKAARGLR